MWLWLFLITALAALYWGGSSYFSSLWQQDIKSSPFLQVTNRQFSIFLWQFPEYMRANVRSKTGYLPGFQYENKISLVVADADKYVVAPPELIFLYHAWHRQISREFTPRPIPLEEFKEFLSYVEEWQPTYWPAAPNAYVQLIKNISNESILKDLNDLPESSLPLEVRQAFEGWKNYFKEGEAINKLKPTFAQVQEFIKSHPGYARNYWRNIVHATTPRYLISLSEKNDHPENAMPRSEIAPFLLVAIYNYLQAHSKH